MWMFWQTGKWCFTVWKDTAAGGVLWNCQHRRDVQSVQVPVVSMSISLMTYCRQKVKIISYKGLKLSTYWAQCWRCRSAAGGCMVAWKCFSQTWGIAWNAEYGLGLHQSKISSNSEFWSCSSVWACLLWTGTALLQLFIPWNSLSCIPLRLKQQVLAKHLPFQGYFKLTTNWWAMMRNVECTLNILACQEARYSWLAADSCKCMLQWISIFFGIWPPWLWYHDNTGILFWVSISRRWAGHITGVSLECQK